MLLLNAFSANMLDFPSTIRFTEVSFEEARLNLMAAAEAAGEADFIRSAVGHADTAALFAEVLGIPVPCQRINVVLKPGDWAILGQYNGPRLAEGCTTLPAGAHIRWLHVAVSG